MTDFLIGLSIVGVVFGFCIWMNTSEWLEDRRRIKRARQVLKACDFVRRHPKVARIIMRLNGRCSSST
jgi:hypothetical protein